MATITDLIQQIGASGSAKFASFVYTAKLTGEESKILVILNASTEVLYGKDVEALTALIPALSGLERAAAEDLLESRKISLAVGIGNNPAYTCADIYVNPIGFPDGVRVHKETGEVYVTGLVESKTVLTPGVYKEKSQTAWAKAKRFVTNEIPSGRFRTYILRNVSTARLNGEVLELDTEPIISTAAA